MCSLKVHVSIWTKWTEAHFNFKLHTCKPTSRQKNVMCAFVKARVGQLGTIGPIALKEAPAPHDRGGRFGTKAVSSMS